MEQNDVKITRGGTKLEFKIEKGENFFISKSDTLLIFFQNLTRRKKKFQNLTRWFFFN